MKSGYYVLKSLPNNRLAPEDHYVTGFAVGALHPRPIFSPKQQMAVRFQTKQLANKAAWLIYPLADVRVVLVSRKKPTSVECALIGEPLCIAGAVMRAEADEYKRALEKIRDQSSEHALWLNPKFIANEALGGKGLP